MHAPKLATTDHPIHQLIAERWSPYAFAEKPIPLTELQSLFEAARWAPSSYNEQPWRYIVATKEEVAEFERLLSCLVEGNQAWAKNAPVIALGCTSLRFELNGNPNAAAVHDLGLASATLNVRGHGTGTSRPSDDWHTSRESTKCLRNSGRLPAAHRAGDWLRRAGRYTS